MATLQKGIKWWILLAGLLCAAQVRAESRCIAVHIAKRSKATVRVSVYSDVASENKKNLKVEEAAAILGKAEGWGSMVWVGIVAHDVPLQSYLPILKAISENVWLDLAFVEGTKPDFLHDNIRRMIQPGKKGAKLKPKELEAHWKALNGNDAAKAYKAIWALVAAPEQSVPFLNKHFQPVPLPDSNQVDKLLTALDSDRFAEREKAMAQLEKMGAPVLNRITKALKQTPSLEKRRRLERLRDRLSPFTLCGVELRTWRALEVLELIGNEPARQVLQRLAKGAPDLWQTKEARMALERLAKRVSIAP